MTILNKDMPLGSEWNNSDTELYLQYGDCFVPYRQEQINVVCHLVQEEKADLIVDLCCGPGLLTEALLKRFPHATVIAMDASETMLETVGKRLSMYKNRLKLQKFDLTKSDWRKFDSPVGAFVSSLAIHHLDAAQKQKLFSDLFQALELGGSFIISDLILPVTEKACKVAANSWDAIVKEQSQKLYNDNSAFETFQAVRWNYYTYPNDDDVDKPSPIVDQLKWLEKSGYAHVEVFWLIAGHAIFGGYKSQL